jgi:hypothetical protein
VKTLTKQQERQAIDAAQSLGPVMARMAEVSRRDPAVFCQFVLRDEQTGQPIRLAPMHEEWHDILNAHKRVVIHTHTEAGKSSLLSIGRVAWEIGVNPAIRILVLSSSSGAAKKIVKSIKNYIENSAEYRSVFPDVTPDKSDTTGMWRDDAFIVRRPTMAKDPTVQASGYGGNVHTGRFDLIIIDDYLTAENTHSQHNRDKFYSWLKSTIETRRTISARLWFVGNTWHVDDAMHRYGAEPNTFSKKYPVIDENGVSSWPEVWPQSRITEEIANRGPIESRRTLFCDPVADADRKFKLEYIQTALTNGDGMELVYALQAVPSGYSTVTGVDLAVTKKTSGDETALVTIAVEHKRQVRQILDITAGRMGGPEIVNAIVDINRRYNSLVLVESNGAQRMLKQFMNDQTAVPVRAFYTGKNKYDPSFGIETLAVEFSQGKWIVPNRGGERAGFNARMAPETKKLLNEMLSYDPQSHTGDRLMALWLAREGARQSAAPPGQGKRPRRT